MKILIVDDDELFLQVQERRLRAHDVKTATTVSDALALLAADPFDVILCDLHMPGESGIAFSEQISASMAGRVIYITGATMNDDEAEFMAKNRTLLKPFNREVLLQAMNEVVGNPSGAPSKQPGGEG